MTRINITFDDGGDPWDKGTDDYSIYFDHFFRQNSGGNPGKCISTFGLGVRNVYRINFHKPVTITYLSMDSMQPYGWGDPFTIKLRFEDGTQKRVVNKPNTRYWQTGEVTNTYDNVVSISYASGSGNTRRGSIDNIIVDYGNSPTEQSKHEEPDCSVDIHASEPVSGSPVSLYAGEKREKVTDLTINTPNDVMAFTRSYRQDKLTDSNFPQVMGLGWSHNHNLYLHDQSEINGEIYVYLGGGGRAHFEKDTDLHYVAMAGGTSEINIDNGSTSARYTLQATDQAYIFDSNGKLQSRTWLNGEKWTYTYINNTLSQVSNEYGHKLEFIYYSTADFKGGQLKRVGDHTVSDLENPTAGERYVEYDYTENKIEDSQNPGTAIDGGDAVLSSIQDIRSSIWTNEYESSDIPTLNWLTRVKSPSVDTDGDDSNDESIIIKDIDYTVSGSAIETITEKLGGTGTVGNEVYAKQVDFAFQPDEDITTETVAGKAVTHLFENGVYAGTENAAGQSNLQSLDLSYRPQTQKDGNGNSTSLKWSDDGKTLESVVDAQDNLTEFIYDLSHRLTRSTNAEGRKVNYVYEGDQRQPTMILSGSDLTEEDLFTTADEADDWSSLDSPNAPATNQRVPYADTGKAMRYVDATSGDGIESIQWDLTDTESYELSARVFVVSGTIKMQISGGSHTTTSVGTDNWETLTISIDPYSGSTLTDRTLQLIADGGNAKFYVDNVSIQNDSVEALFDGSMEANWRDVGSPTTNELSTAQADDGSVSRYIVASSADEGIASDEFDAHPGFSYTVSAHVYVTTGKVRLKVTDVPDAENAYKDSNLTNQWETLTFDWTPAETLQNTSIQIVSKGAGATFYVDQVSILRDGTEQIIDGSMEDQWVAITSASHERVIGAESGDYARRVVTTASGHGIKNDNPFDLTTGNTYLAMARVYVVSGSLKMAVNGVSNLDTSTSRTGKWKTLHLVTTDPSATDATLEFVADGDAAEFYIDQVHLVKLSNYTDLAVVQWQEYILDRRGRSLAETMLDVSTGNIIRTSEKTYYDSNGLLESITQIDPQDASNDFSVTYTYDSVGRVIKTHRSSLLGTCQFSYTIYDNAGNVEATVCGRQNVTAPTTVLAAEGMYDANDATKKHNNVTTHTYDTMGRRVTITTNAGNTVLEKTTRVIHDALGRVIYQIANYDETHTYDAPITWTFDDASGEWQDDSDTPIDHGDDLNENIISRTEYNERGLVRWTQDHLGNVVLYGYDDADRLVKTIQNAATTTYNNDYSGTPNDPSLSDYTEDTTTEDIDIITEQFYDAAGNLVKTIDPAGRINYTVYDTLNRPVKTIQNAKDSAITDETDPSYVDTNDPRSSNYVISTDVDRDQINETEYDALGRVIRTKRLLDIMGTAETWDVTLVGYDVLGRQVKTIAHALDDEYDISSDPDLSAYSASTDTDVDIITETFYNAEGQVAYTKDSEGRETHYAYDGLQRQMLTVGNFIDDTPTPYQAIDNWIWDDVTDNQREDGNNTAIAFGSANDQNILSKTSYDADGYVLFTRDVDGRIQRFVYDELGRQVRTIQNFVDNGEGPSLWVWDDTTDNRWEESGGTAIDYGTNDDQNIITETVYDDHGRVESTRDTLDNVTFFVYDNANRQVRTIQNYVSNGEDPSLWKWDDVNKLWEKSDEITPISHGTTTNDDQNQISITEYDLAGRVKITTDTRHNQTYVVYDELGRRIRTIQNYVSNSEDPSLWIWDATAGQWEKSDDTTAISHGSDIDENVISDTIYAKDGRVVSTRGRDGNVTQFVYDDAGRRIRTIQNYVEPTSQEDPALWVWDITDNRWEESDGEQIAHGSVFDQNLITETLYNKVGQVTLTRDARGTQTTFSYGKSQRRVSVTQAANTALASTSYTCYDKLGRVLRTITNWKDDGTNPDAVDGNGDWIFDPMTHGFNNDENLIIEYEYDNANRRVKVTNPNEDNSQTSYFVNGTVDTVTDPKNIKTAYRYDSLRRRTRVVQNYISTNENTDTYTDPETWVWSTDHWEDATESPLTIEHHLTGESNEYQNIIVDVSYDTLGRMTQMLDPRHKATDYKYDRLGRRTKLTNPLGKEWKTTYENIGNVTQTTMNYPGINGGASYDVERDFDRLGRLTEINYADLTNTPTIQFAYDTDGNRQTMTEVGTGSATIRETTYGYDELGRLTSVGFDTDGDSTIDETVSYEYDISGNRTELKLPNNDTIEYAYDDKGRLVSMTDWDNQTSTFQYDNLGRHIGTQRSNGFYSQYAYNPAGHLQALRHGESYDTVKTLQSFVYATDALGNRSKANEIKFLETAGSNIILEHDDETIVYRGNWQATGDYQESAENGAKLSIMFYGNTGINLTMGTGADCGIYDVYINKTLWQSYDGYASVAGDVIIPLEVKGSDAHLLEIYQRQEKNSASSGYKVRFKSFEALAAYEKSTIDYTYDDLSRLLTANYDGGAVEYSYGYDLAGNLVDMDGTTRTFNVANQMTNDGTNTLTYDNNGNLTSDGTNTHTWDRANRLLSVGNHSYAYDGNSARIQKTAGSTVTDYLLDVNQGLTQVLSETTGANTQHYIHAPRGIHAMNDGTNWSYMLQDGLGSVRAEIAQNVAVNGSQSYAPYGEVFGVSGTMSSPFAFTGEPLDGNGLQYHRARYYSPQMGVWASLDPFEGLMDMPMSLNGYGYASGNVVNRVDPSGRQDMDDGGAPLPVAGFVKPNMGSPIGVNPIRYTSATVNNVKIGISSLRPGAPLAPTGNYTNVARIVINQPSGFLSGFDVAYNTRFISGSAIARQFNGQVGAMFNVSGQNIWAICVGVGNCPSVETQPAIQEPDTETSVSPAVYSDYATALQTFADFYNHLSPEQLAKVCNTACYPQLQPNTSQTQQQVVTATPSGNNKQWGCNLKDKAPNVAGSLIETAIWNLFSTAFGTSNTSHQSPSIPKAHRSGDGRNGQPDLVLWLNRIYNNNSLPVDIYEVKPITYNPTSTGNSTLNAQGRAQLARYVNNFWRTGLATSANAGTTWNPAGSRFPSPIDSSQDVILYTYYPSQSSENGMIYYACEDR